MALNLVIISICSVVFCLFRPFHRNNVYHAARFLGKTSHLLGLEVEVRIPEHIRQLSPAVYVCNHQNSYDIFTLSNAVLPGTVSIGKKSLKWIPFFGQMYWLTGNILIDRKNTNKAMNTIAVTAEKIKEKKLSVWLFPEGTRSNGRGVLPFKTGAFRTALQAGVPIVPVCASEQHGKIKLNRWNNGKLIIEFMEPIFLDDVSKEDLRAIANQTRDKMIDKIAQINQEATADER